MKRLSRFLAILLCLSMVFTLAACQTDPTVSTTESSSESTQPSTGSEAPSAAALYDEAKAALDAAAALEMTITATENKTFAGEHYEQTITQTVTLTGRGTDGFESYISETVVQGDITFSSTEYYDGSTVYMDFEGALYSSGMTTEDYLARLLPIALLDSSLYGQINQEGTTLTFSDPTAGESWVMPQAAVLEDAVGTATLSASGTLTSTSYQARYRCGAVGMEISVTADISVSENTALSQKAPADPDAYTVLKDIDAPMLVEQAIAMIHDTNTATAAINQQMYSDMSERSLVSTATACSYGSVENLMALIALQYELSDANGVIRSYDDSAVFRDGTCTDGFSTAQEMKDDCLMYMTRYLPHGTQLGSAKITDAGTLYLLEMDADDAYAQTIYGYLCDALFEDDPTYLDDQSSDYKLRKLDITLSIDKYTGFPVFFSFEYVGRHTIDGEKYYVNFDMETTYDLGSSDAYKEITGEDPPEAEPENKATPLFYHVTGSNGEEMWLLGTIHIGDERTAFLPQEIYDAFDAADALAVEFDTIAFVEQMQTDKKLQTQISMAYTYINGTTLKDHVDKEVYDAAIDASKAMGIYDDTLVYYKAGALESYISQYYQRHIPEYHAEKGVDHRLLTMAKEQNKTILDIENGLDQMKMFTNCSKELQEYLLAGTLCTNAAEYHDGVMELYEAWCSGDEAAVRDLVIDDPADLADMSDDEKAIYEEYKKIMEHDRNIGMLNKAIEYLESGDVIFYAVGTAHVLADDGLVNTLRDAGYTVELVSYA